MVKSDVDLRSDSIESLDNLIRNWWPLESISSFTILRGGYSGTNYKFFTQKGSCGVIKICNGYDKLEIEEQSRCTAFLASSGFNFACCPLPLAGDENSFVALTDDNVPAILLTFIDGKAADYLLENRLFPPLQILSTVGRGLAQLHSVGGEQNHLRSFMNGGACFVGQHIQGYFKNIFESHDDPFIKEHLFVRFYFERVDSMVVDIMEQGLPSGVLHGDPFLDNILLNQSTGELR